MALMKFREPNQVQWVGTRPAHRGTQIAANVFVDNVTTIIYTVSAGKTLYLCHAILASTSIVAGNGVLKIRDAVDADWIHLARAYQTALSWGQNYSIPFWPPLEIPALYDVVVLSNAVGCSWLGGIHGWEE